MENEKFASVKPLHFSMHTDTETRTQNLISSQFFKRACWFSLKRKRKIVTVI